jgi:putative colanic acid biosynthesis UDP-glucose lipid carrier transferase
MTMNQSVNYRFWKRVFDFSISLIFILGILSWLLPLIALLIKWDSKGPVFFLQKRVGKGGRSFICFKFRTMIANPEANAMQAVPNDRRITRMGKFLRKSNIDEFPQFLNVMIGDMSIVGPRPHMHSDFSRFSALIPGYSVRNLVRPGITGLSQVKGYCGPAPTYESIFYRYHWDTMYIRSANFWLDIVIIGRTALQHIHFLLGTLAAA